MKLTKSTFLFGCLVGGLSSAIVPFLLDSTQADTKFLPFQGHLTDASGDPIPDGAKVVEFKMYDAPVGGNAKWAGEVHKLSVNGGLVNTMLGSKASLGQVDFSTATYLQITVDANDDNQITAADPPLLPRQSIIPSVYASEAGNARQLNSHPAAEYEQIFVNADPSTGILDGSKLRPLSVAGGALLDNTVTENQISKPLNQRLTSLESTRQPIGVVLAWPAAEGLIPDGWKVCKGQEISQLNTSDSAKSRLEELFNGQNLPDFQGHFLRGASDANPLMARQEDTVGRHGHQLNIYPPDPDHNPPQSTSFWDPARPNYVQGGRAIAGGGRAKTVNDKLLNREEKPADDNETRPVNFPIHWIVFIGLSEA
ncbi:MAG: hypothetical protein R3F19_06275 [Verrucomicrobiales bacterium]